MLEHKLSARAHDSCVQSSGLESQSHMTNKIAQLKNISPIKMKGKLCRTVFCAVTSGKDGLSTLSLIFTVKYC